MISQTVEYALRAMVYLTGEAPAARTTNQIAAATQVPRAYLSKVLQGLGRSNLVQTHRGVGGGVSLSKPATETTILEVVNAVEPLERIRSCPLGLEAHGVHLCPLHRRLDDALASVEQAFATCTLAEIMGEATRSKPLCDVQLEKKKKVTRKSPPSHKGQEK